MNISKNVLVFSVWQASKTQRTNIENTLKIVEVLSLNQQNEFFTVVGHYNNKTEISFVVKNTLLNKALVWGLARKFHQESVLEVSEQKEASLVFLDQLTPEKLAGSWQACSARLAKKLGSSSYEPLSNTNWSVFHNHNIEN